MRLKKSKIKEWIREDIKSFFLEAEDDDKKDSEKSDGAPEGGLGPTKLKIDIPDSPFDNEDKPKTAKATQLKELVKKKLKELKFKNPDMTKTQIISPHLINGITSPTLYSFNNILRTKP